MLPEIQPKNVTLGFWKMEVVAPEDEESKEQRIRHDGNGCGVLQ